MTIWYGDWLCLVICPYIFINLRRKQRAVPGDLPIQLLYRRDRVCGRIWMLALGFKP